MARESLSEEDYNKARRYLRWILSDQRVAGSTVSGMLTNIVLHTFGSLSPGARERSSDEEAILRAHHLEQIARSLKRRQNPSSVFSGLVEQGLSEGLAKMDGWTRDNIQNEFQRIGFSRVAMVEGEKIVAPVSAWFRKWRI